MSKTSKQNGGSKVPMLPSLDQLPTLPGFAVPAGHPAVPTQTPVAGQKPQSIPQDMSELPPMPQSSAPPIIEPTTGEIINLQQQDTPLPVETQAVRKTVRLADPDAQEVRLADPDAQEVRLADPDAQELPGFDDIPAMPGLEDMPEIVEDMPETIEEPPTPAPEEIKAEETQKESKVIAYVDPTEQDTEAKAEEPVGRAHPHLRPSPDLGPVLNPDLGPVLNPEPVSVQQVAPPQETEDMYSPKAAADITLSDLLRGVTGEDAVNVNDVLDQIPGLAGGPSEGGFSWHTLEPCLACWRKAYHTHVLGLVPHTTPRALNWGSLWHACWELWYKFGGQRKYDEPCDAVRQAGAPKLAGEVQRMMYAALKKYAEEESATWDVRAVENNAVFWGEPERVDGKTVYIPISCRHDLIVAKRRPGTACHPEGPVPHGTYICDHKCIANGERLWDVHMGRRRPVETLRNGTRLPTVLISGRTGAKSDFLRSDRANFADNGVKPVWELKLSSGRKMRVTDNHPVWTSGGWRLARDLQKGDFVACAPCTSIEGEATLSDAEAELLGYYIGNGSSDEHSLGICTGQSDLLNRITELLDSIDSTYGIDEANGRVPNCKIHKNTRFRATVEECELIGKTAPYKFVPDAILGTDQRQLEIFLAALWTVDGCVTSTPSRGDLRIVYTTRSEVLARDVQQLLWRLGIWASNHDYLVNYNGENKPYWQVAVIGREAKHLFISKLFHRIYHREGMTEEQAAKLIDAKKAMGDADRVPSHLVAEVCENVGRTRIKGRHLCNLTDTAGISKWVVKAMAEEEPNLQALAESKIHWDDVVSCEYIGDLPTTSVTIPHNPVFLSEDGIITHNTSSALTYDLTKGYAMDGQFKTNALVYLRSGEVKQFGPLNGIIVSVAVKHKEPNDRSLHRIETAIDEKSIEEFYQYEIKPFALEFYRRLASERYRGDKNLWPRNTTHCVNRYGCCSYFDLCDIGGYSVLESMFKVDENRKFTLDRLAEPPIEVKRASKLADPKKRAAEEARKERAQKRREFQEALLVAFSDSAQNMDRFNSKHYIVPNHSDKEVMDKLVEALATGWTIGTTFKYFLPDEKGKPVDNFEMEITDKGVAWKEILSEKKQKKNADDKKVKKPTPHKGLLTYKAIAEAVCQDWWDLDKIDPKDAQ